MNIKYIMKSNRDNIPPVIEDLGDGTSHYNFDVVKEEEGYSYGQVTVINPVTVSKIKEALTSEGYEHEVELEGLPTPSQITMRQTKLALLNKGLLDTVNQAVATLDQAAQIEWEYSAVTERNSPFVAQMGLLLGLSESEVDELFIYAEGL